MLKLRIETLDMKIFLIVFIFIFNLQSLTKADDIQEFEIDGISIGDSLLEFATINKINLGKRNYYNDDEFSVTELYPEDFKIKKDIYDIIQFNFKTKDKKKIIYAFSGIVSYKNNIKDCYAQLDKVYNEVVSIFSNWKDLGKETYEHTGGQGQITDYVLENDSRDEIQIACYDYTNNDEDEDHFRIALRTLEYRIWLLNKAYK